MAKDWYLFQEEIKDYCELLGCDAKTNVTINGTRTTHDIDVFIESKFLGHNIKWIIEAKKWKSKVSKLHVLALRQIVEDIGVDKGFIISEKGFQKGAVEAAKNTNLKLMTFEEFKTTTNDIFHQKILTGYLNRFNLIVNRYYSHTKAIRVKYNLRQDSFEFGFDTFVLLMLIAKALGLGIKNKYPIELTSYEKEQYGDEVAENFYQLVNWINLKLLSIEERIFKAEIDMQKNKEFHPQLEFINPEKNIQLKALKMFAKVD